jgi:hypothetical protein
MTDKEKKPPVWAYADEWDNMSDVERAVRLSYLCGVQAWNTAAKATAVCGDQTTNTVIHHGISWT